MARKQREEPEEGAVATEEAQVDPVATMDAGTAAALLARKQEHGTARPWGPFKKATTEIPERLIGAEFTIWQPRPGATPEETWGNILVYCGGSHEAALDTFNSAYRLDNQKSLKEYFTGEGALDIPDLQERSNRHQATPSSRGKGGRRSAKVRAERAEAKLSVAAQSMEEMIAALEAVDPDQAEAFRQRLAALQGA